MIIRTLVVQYIAEVCNVSRMSLVQTVSEHKRQEIEQQTSAVRLRRMLKGSELH
jgi:hypothetical protein